MTDRNQVQAAASGCLSRVFTLIGLFWLGVAAIEAFNSFRFGGTWEFLGGLVPALGFLIAGRVMRRRSREAAAQEDGFSAPSTPDGTHRATTRPPTSEPGPTPSPTLSSEGTEPDDESAERSRANRPVPELPPIEPAPNPGKLQAVEDLDISDFESDFESGKPLSSDEMIRRARQKFRPKGEDS